MKERGDILGWIIVAVGVVLLLVAIGFFRPDKQFFNTVNYKTALHLQCGLTVSSIDAKNHTIHFPYHLSGWINGCGWEMTGFTAGMVQVFDSKGVPLSASTPLVYNDTGTELPRPFIAYLTLIAVPTVDTGTLVFTSTTGLVETVSISF